MTCPDCGSLESQANATWLADKAVVVTGAARGLGRAFALAAAQAGANVLVNDVDESEARKVVELIGSFGGSAVASIGSVAEVDTAEALSADCEQAFGQIDGIVNNAALFPRDFRPWEDRPEMVRPLVEVNLLGTIFATNAAVRRMRKRGTGAIVNVTSGAHLGIRNSAIYAATKGAIASLTYSWALDLMAEGITVNAISPIALTRMNRSFPDAAQPEAVAPLVVFLLSSQLSGGMTGQLIRMTGRELGLTRHPRDGQMITRDSWTAEDVARAFTKTLGAELEPIGRPEAPSPTPPAFD